MTKEKTLSDSQLKIKNELALKWFMYWTSIPSAATLVFMLLGWLGGYSKVMTIFGIIVQGICYRWIAAMANSGVDVEKGAENTQDVIFITAFVQICSLFSAYVWFLWLVVPMTGFWKLWIGYIWPWFTYDPEANLTDEDRARMAKKQKKQEKRQTKYGR
jgi:hypothetical protein